MPTQFHNPPTGKTCLFSTYYYRQLLAQNLTGKLALRFKRRYPAIVVKFAGFEGGVI